MMSFSQESCVGLFEVCGNRREWRPRFNDAEVREAIGRTAAHGQNHENVLVQVLSVNSFVDLLNEGGKSRLSISSPIIQELVGVSGFSKTFVEGILDVQWKGPGCFLRYDDRGRPVRFDMSYTSECGWNRRFQVSFAVNFICNTMTYLVVGCPAEIILRIVKVSMDASSVFETPFGLDTFLLDCCLTAWTDAVTRSRDDLLLYDYHNPDDHGSSDAIRNLHDLCSTLHRPAEHVTDLEQRVHFFQSTLRRYNSAISFLGDDRRKRFLDRSSGVEDSLAHLLLGADICKRWAKNYNSRTQLRENLCYHTISQRNSRVNERNAAINLMISKLTSDDSKAMIALSVLAMIFLPGIFVAGIFSMAFFTNPSSRNLGLSWIWLYFAVTVPLTLLIYLIWALYKRKGLQRKSLQIPDDMELVRQYLTTELDQLSEEVHV